MSANMASIPNEYKDALWEAAKDEELESWQELKGFLKAKRIDTTMQRPEEWMKLLAQYQDFWRKGAIRDQASPVESLSDSVSLSDSAIDINDQPRFVYAVSDRYRERYPDGKIPLQSIHSVEAQEHYIIETICKRLGLQRDKNGKVNFTYIHEGGKKTFEMHCCVKQDEEGEADIVFSTKVLEEIKEESAQRAANASDDESDRNRSRSRKSSNGTQNSSSSNQEDLYSRIAMAHLVSDPRVHNLEDKKVMDIARKLKVSLSVLDDNT